MVMPQIAIKIYLIFLSALIITSAILFFSLNKPDHLAAFVPKNAEVYLHTSYNSFTNLKTDWQFASVNLLAQKSALTYKDWRTVIDTEPKELAAFSVNGQFFLLVKNNRKLKNLLETTTISHSLKGNTVIFPEFQFGDEESTESWIAQKTTNLNFSDFILMTNDFTKFSFPIRIAQTEPMLIKGNIKGETLRFKLNLEEEIPFFENKSAISPQVFPDNTKIYLQNISKDFFNYEAESVEDNIKYLLLKSFPTIEYLEVEDGFVLNIDKTIISSAETEREISKILAKIYPIEVTKSLPDGSIAKHLIADESKWQFIDQSGGRILKNSEIPFEFELFSGESNLSLSVRKTGSIATYTNSFYENGQLQNPLVSLCPITKKQNKILINTKQQGIKDINTLLISQKSATTIDICID
ncbi:MAG: hypothetical protein WCT18_04965 [Patescibacteria group bacterium]